MSCYRSVTAKRDIIIVIVSRFMRVHCEKSSRVPKMTHISSISKLTVVTGAVWLMEVRQSHDTRRSRASPTACVCPGMFLIVL